MAQATEKSADSVTANPAEPLVAGAAPRPQLDRLGWIEKGLETIASAGVAAVRVEVLARDLGVTKGSFYWHFRDRQELLSALLQEWRRRTTTHIVEFLWGRPHDARTKLRRLWLICFSGRVDNPGARLEIAIRQWALHDPLAAAMVARNDTERLEFVKQLYVELGCEDAEARARLYYFHILGHNLTGQTLGLANPRVDMTILKALLVET